MTYEIKSIPLIEICEAIVDCPHSTPKWTDEGVIVLRNSNIKNGRLDLSNPSFTDELHYEDRSRRAKLQKGDLVITREAPMGEVCEIPDNLKCCLGQRMVLLRPSKEKCDGKYLLYALQSRKVQHEINSYDGTGSTVSNLRIPVLKNLSIPTPTLSIQKDIAQILGTLDAKIELNKKTNETLEVIAKTIFKSWFVDFDPVKAKTEGRSTGLPDDISNLFPANLENKDIGPVPEGWSWRRLGDLISLGKGVSYKGKFLSESEGLPMINLGCFAGEGKFREEKMKFYAGKYNEQHIANSGDILVANTDITQDRIILGSPIIMPKWKTFQKFLFSHHVFVLRLNEGKSDWSGFIFQSLLRTKFRHIAIGYATGTTVLALPKDGIMEYQITIPPQKLVACYDKFFKNLYARIENNYSQNLILHKLRNTLLPKLISGELRIPDAEKMIEEIGI